MPLKSSLRAGSDPLNWGHYTKRKKLYAKRPPLFRGSGPFRALTPGSFILGSLDDVIAFAAFVMITFLGPNCSCIARGLPRLIFGAATGIWNFVWKARITRLGYC